jgi:hypothetical protein
VGKRVEGGCFMQAAVSAGKVGKGRDWVEGLGCGKGWESEGRGGKGKEVKGEEGWKGKGK